MKFSELKERYSELKKKYGGKKHIKTKDLNELRGLLAERQQAYESKLVFDLKDFSDKKREKIKLRIRVIKAQIKKIDKLLNS